MITTSYMANYRKHSNRVPICIMRWKPQYFNGIHYPLLSPTSESLSAYKDGRISFDVFEKEILQQLNHLNPKEVLHQLEQFGDNIVLLCTCKNYEYCHRKIVADWLSNELHLEVKEL